MRRFSLLLSALAILSATALPMLGQAQEPQTPSPSGVRLVYDLPVEALQRSQRTATPLSLEQMLAAAVETVQIRVGNQGKVARDGTTGFTVELPRASAERVAEVRRRIENPGLLEMRVVATDDYVDGKDDNKKPFDLAQEKQRLDAWLKNGGKAQLEADRGAIDRYNDDVENGPIAKGGLRWFVHLLEPDQKAPARWSYSFTQGSPDLTAATVRIYEDADFNGGVIPKGLQQLTKDRQKLVELVAINMAEVHFSGADLDAEGASVDISQDGTPCVDYRIAGSKAAAYGDWSEKYIKKHAAIILNGVIRSAPVFISRIPGNGQITGSFTQAEAEDLALVLRSRPLPVVPVLMRQEPAAKGGPASRGR